MVIGGGINQCAGMQGIKKTRIISMASYLALKRRAAAASGNNQHVNGINNGHQNVTLIMR